MKRTMTEMMKPLTVVLMYFLLAYVVYFVARVAYLLVNWEYFAPALTGEETGDLLRGALVFDTSAIMVTHIPVVVLVLLTPWRRLARWVFVVINGTALAVNLCDAVYFRYTMRRTTTTVFTEFRRVLFRSQNLTGIFLHEALSHWYLVVLFGVMVWLVWLAGKRIAELKEQGVSWWWSAGARLCLLALLAPFIVAGIRGGFTTAVRPITISNANQYVNRPMDAALVLNTPFSLYRTIGKAVFVVPDYFSDEQEMAVLYSPVHIPNDSVPMTKKNVVVLIVESFGREYIGALNKTLENSQYKGYTPCIDSLIAKSITFTRSYCNGRKSIDGMPSVLSSIPMFVEPFFLTPASMNHVSGIAER